MTILYAFAGLFGLGIGTALNHFHPMFHETYEHLFIQNDL